MMPADPLAYARNHQDERVRAAVEARLARSVRAERRSHATDPTPSPWRRLATRFRPQPATVACC